MDTEATNPNASVAASFFDLSAASQIGGSTVIDLDTLSTTTFSNPPINIGNGVTVEGNTNSSLVSGTQSTNVDGISLFSVTSAGDLVFTFSTPTTHFGFYNNDFNTVATGFNLLFDEGTGPETIDIASALGGDGGEGFFGVVFDQAVPTLTLQGTGGSDVYYLDNFRVTPVPEPSAFALIASLLALTSVMARRRPLREKC